jgi:hypothetical protein
LQDRKGEIFKRGPLSAPLRVSEREAATASSLLRIPLLSVHRIVKRDEGETSCIPFKRSAARS